MKCDFEHPFKRWAQRSEEGRRKNKDSSRSRSCFESLDVLQPDASQDLQGGRGQGDQVLGQSVPGSRLEGLAVLCKRSRGDLCKSTQVRREAYHRV